MATKVLAPKADGAAPIGKVDGLLIYAIGDVHGCYEPLRNLLEKIVTDAEREARGRPVRLIFCGDYVDRGPASREVIEALCWLKRYGPLPTHFLKGNHEEVMLHYIADPSAAREWLNFGGAETLRSYGVTPPLAEDPAEAHLIARDDLLERLPVAHLRFLEGLELMVGAGDYAFVHAGVRAGLPLDRQSPADLLWIRQDFLDVERQHERIIVHGHTWTGDQPTKGPRRIGIDTGVYETGVLTAVRIEDGAVEFLSAR